ncbi:6-phosphogluconolactonase [Naumannella halotolerans]|uniref:6-phosphogluconolactonase n=1 Tax=Naumannella halotolerans TaxID=993414 RepID=UPI00370DC8F5
MSDELNIFPDAEQLATAVSAALVTRISELQAESDHRVVQLCLTGGTIATKIHRKLASNLGSGPVDPGRIELWWGDERFVATDSPDRNAEPTIELLAVDGLAPERIHPMPSAAGLTLAEAAEAYAAELGEVTFDICMLGLGPDGHIASLFPDHPSLEPTSATVIPVTDSPKPPPERISLTLPVINSSAEVWFLVSGEEKAAAAAKAYRRSERIPGGRAHGTVETIFWLDEEAAGEISD